jgi:hypothetical protein
MKAVHYAAIRFADRWKLVGKGLRWGDYETLDEAMAAAQRLAQEAAAQGLEVHLYAHRANGELAPHLE